MLTTNEIEVVRKDLAPLELKVFAVLIVLATNYKILTFTFYEVSPWVYIIGNLAAFIIWTAKDILIVDFRRKQVREGVKVFALRYTIKTNYSEFEKIFINKVNTSETFRQLTRSMTIRHQNYKAFLKTMDGDKFWIFVSPDKDKLMKKVQTLNERIKTEIYDNTRVEKT